ncbi:MAG: ABC transporter ATP-binding protein [Calditrichaeota bacterium]|nr:ABC transporter ATP-binding protein [Calditrichota bacterium]
MESTIVHHPADTTAASPGLVYIDAAKTYGEVVALKALNLEVQRGELFGCLGPNGAGKTTAMKLAVGLVIPTSGRVLVCSHDIQTDPIPAKQCIGFIPDNSYIYDSLTGREFLHYCAGLHKLNGNATVEVVRELLDRFEVRDWADRRCAGYSHGMRQRLVMASAFLHRPQVILIDEPMVGLDPAGMRLVKRILRDFVEAGGTVMLSTHTLADAEELCDRVGIIHRGELIACGPVAEIRREAGRLEDAFIELTSGSGE